MIWQFQIILGCDLVNWIKNDGFLDFIRNTGMVMRTLYGRSLFFLAYLLAVCGYGMADSIMENSESNHKIKIAVCYWGLTRSTSLVYESHFKNLFNVLTANGIDYDVFMHTWKLKGKQRIWENEINEAINYDEYKLLNPKYYKIEDQDDFTVSLDFDQYFYKEI